MGATVAGGTAGHILDLAGVTASYDADIGGFGTLLGLGLGLVVAALIGGPDRDYDADS